MFGTFTSNQINAFIVVGVTIEFYEHCPNCEGVVSTWPGNFVNVCTTPTKYSFN